MAQRDRAMATEHKASEAVPYLRRTRCQFCRPQPAFHGKCTDPFGRKGECACHIFEETHRWQWDFIAGLNRGDDLGHDAAKDTDDGLPHDKVIRGWEEDRQEHES